MPFSLSVNIKKALHDFEMSSNLNLKEQIMCCQRAAHRTRNAKSVHVNNFADYKKLHEPKRIISIPKCNDCIQRLFKDFVQILDFEN